MSADRADLVEGDELQNEYEIGAILFYISKFFIKFFILYLVLVILFIILLYYL